ncbi:MAG: M24 family metallopeptidase [Terrimicrobiaceae bacterium]|nr:M24 family metallopeptidase [Terrimicrobiaceae bacterium]
MSQSNPARLIVAASESNADQLYATGFHAPDAFAFVESGGRTAILLSNLEIDRGRKQARVDAVEAYADYEALVRRRKKAEPQFAEVIAAFAKRHKAARPLVPSDFPAGLAGLLAKLGVAVRPVEGHFWPRREVKTAEEIRAIAAASRITETGLDRAVEILRASRIRKDRRLEWAGAVLTSERLRAEAESAMLFAGGFAMNNSIVAGGGQACDPHERGHGPLKAHELIILDIFPRSAKSGFYGDLTRTVVRGRAGEAQRQMWTTCLEGQRRALKALRPGSEGKAIQDAIREFFTESGYPTEQRKGRWQGFFHGLGHGLGLDLHEEPRIARTTLRPGQVFTVEPGIYVPGIGGVRHEDVVAITAGGHRVLSRFPKPLEI